MQPVGQTLYNKTIFTNFMSPENIIEAIRKTVSEKTKVPVYDADIRRILSALQITEDFWEIIFYSEVPIPAASEILKELNKNGYIEFKEESIVFTNKGKDLVKELEIPKPYYKKCPHCQGRGISLEDFEDVLKEFKKIAENRPEAIQQYDQGYVLPEVTVSRVALMANKMDIQNKKLLVIGDDDLTSIAAGLSGLPKDVVVLEIDERLVNFINNVAKEYGLNVSAEIYDIRDPLPERHYAKYDTFITDPSETKEALRLFISRGISGLRGPRCAGYFGITRAEASLEKWYYLQRMLLDMRVVITDMIHNFNVYVNWGYVEKTRAMQIAPVKRSPKREWYTSTMYRIETLEGFVRYNEPAKEDIYEDEESSTV